MDSLDKIKAQADIAIAEVKALMAYLWLKGGPGSGNWGHAGRPGKRGGSMERGQGMSLRTGRDAERRQAAAKAGGDFFKGNIKTASTQEIYDGSSAEVKALADDTGLIATDARSLDYIKRNQKDLTAIRPMAAPKVVTTKGLEDSLDDMLPYHRAGETLAGRLNNGYCSGPGKFYKHPGVNLATAHALKQLVDTTSADGVTAGSKAPGSMDFRVCPTNAELDVLQKIAAKTTPTGQLGVNAVKAFDKLTVQEKAILEQYGTRAASLELVDNAANGASYKAGIYFERLTARRDIINKISVAAIKDPIGPNETLADYSRRMIKNHYKVDDPAPQARFKTNEMGALATVSANEKADTMKRIDDSWDRNEHGGFRAKTKDVFYIKDSPDNEAKFAEARDKAGGKTTHLWHGSSTMSAGRIVSTGFIVPPANDPKSTGRMLDNGVYLAHNASKSAQYLRPDGQLSRQPGTTGALLLTEAVLGKQVAWEKNANWRRDFVAGKYDTVFAAKGTTDPNRLMNPLKNHEWAVRNPAAVRPRYLVDVELTRP